GLRPGMRCLDVGCGGGDVSFELAQIVGPEGRVTGLDMGETKLGLARQEAAPRQLSTVEFRRAEIGAAELESGFDLVYARFLLTHLNDPMTALAKMRRARRRGGGLAGEGVEPEVGPKLPGMLCDLGLARVRMNVVLPAGREPAGTEGEAKLVAP